MPRIPYIFPAKGESEIADRIRLRREAGKLTLLDGMILNAPSIAEGYNALANAVRNSNSLPAEIRELMILRVAALNSAAYEWIQHEPIARQAGLSSKQLAVIRDVSSALVPASSPSASTSLTASSTKNSSTDATLNADDLNALQFAALSYTDHMTRTVAVPQEVFDNLRAQLANDQQMFEATATIATYNMVSRMLVALDIADKSGEEVPHPTLSLCESE